MKKKLTSITSVIVLSSLAVACSSGGSGSGTGGTPSSTPGASQAPGESPGSEAAEKVNFSMLMVDHPNWPYNKDWVVWDWIEEHTGATFNVQLPSGELQDTINLNVASGSMPDITFFSNRQEANKFGQQGVLANVLDYIDVMPNLKAWMDQYPEITMATLAADGGMYMLPNEGFGETNRIIWMYREDVFEEHGIETPKTYDDLIEVARELKQLYPDSYPFAFRSGNALEILRFTSPQFGTHNDFFLDGETGEVRYGPTEDAFKELVAAFNTLYEEGLIPPDWLTVNVQQWQDMVSNDKTFILLDYIGRLDLFNLPLKEQNPDFNLAFMTPPEGRPGFAVNPHTHILQAGFTVSSKSDKIEEAFRALDWYYSEEGKEILSWGKDDVVYVTENGERKLRSEYADVTDVRKKTGLATNGTYTWFDYDAHLVPASEEQRAAYDLARQHDSQYIVNPQFNESELNEVTLLQSNIEKHMQEQITRFILGERPLDQWDDYVAEAKNLGLDQLMEFVKEAYNRLQ
ncbi:extracellular solute-binding protein [Paenibacillus senegalensis]|uniref:extracellular solute-binding protein n=1 Tax=Paenibacillus senegalensis TaxID=1465766 RepID=UPI000289C519|nr:extracellular solute-binding protein [Paenibacillus senegalensis]